MGLQFSCSNGFKLIFSSNSSSNECPEKERLNENIKKYKMEDISISDLFPRDSHLQWTRDAVSESELSPHPV